MMRRDKRDFTRVEKEAGEWFDQWIDNLVAEDTTMTMSYGADGPECTFHYDGKFMVAHQFEGELG